MRSENDWQQYKKLINAVNAENARTKRIISPGKYQILLWVKDLKPQQFIS